MTTPVTLTEWAGIITRQRKARGLSRGITAATVRAWRHQPDFPAPLDPHARVARYSLAALERWADEQS